MTRKDRTSIIVLLVLILLISSVGIIVESKIKKNHELLIECIKHHGPDTCLGVPNAK